MLYTAGSNLFEKEYGPETFKKSTLTVNGPTLTGKVSLQYQLTGLCKDQIGTDQLVEVSISYTNDVELETTLIKKVYITKDCEFEVLADFPLCNYLIFELINNSKYNITLKMIPAIR